MRLRTLVIVFAGLAGGAVLGWSYMPDIRGLLMGLAVGMAFVAGGLAHEARDRKEEEQD